MVTYSNGTIVSIGDIVEDVNYGYGTVIVVCDEDFGVKFDRRDGELHTLEGRCEDCHGWWFLSGSECVSFVSKSLDPQFGEFESSDFHTLL